MNTPISRGRVRVPVLAGRVACRVRIATRIICRIFEPIGSSKTTKAETEWRCMLRKELDLPLDVKKRAPRKLIELPPAVK
jgi:hypothetical protein